MSCCREAPACRPSLIKSINLFNVNEGEIEKKSIEQSSLSSDELNHSTDDPDRTRYVSYDLPVKNLTKRCSFTGRLRLAGVHCPLGLV